MGRAGSQLLGMDFSLAGWMAHGSHLKVYSPQDGQIQIHQNRVAPCPPELPSGFFRYGTRRARPGRPPKWVNQLLQGDLFTDPEDAELPEDPSATEPGEDPVTAGDVEDSPSPEDLLTENQDEDPIDRIEDTLATDTDSLSDIPDEGPLMPAEQDIDDAYITHNSAQGPTPGQERQPAPKTKYKDLSSFSIDVCELEDELPQGRERCKAVKELR